MRKMLHRVGLALVLVMALGGCYGIPQGTRESVSVGKLQLLIKGAGLVTADTEKTTFRIKCGHCGFEAGEMTMDTPSVGKPYILNWVCSKCRNKQTIIIEASGL
jgi:hypothetical protein